jgi:hypothetical protein
VNAAGDEARLTGLVIYTLNDAYEVVERAPLVATRFRSNG